VALADEIYGAVRRYAALAAGEPSDQVGE